MIASHAAAFLGEAGSVTVLVGGFILLMCAASRAERLDARRQVLARRVRRTPRPSGAVRKLPR